MNKRKRIKELEADLALANGEVLRREDETQHTHDSLWRILSVLCEEFGLHLTIQSKDEPDLVRALLDALDSADQLVPHSPEQDDVMDIVWDLVAQIRTQNG